MKTWTHNIIFLLNDVFVGDVLVVVKAWGKRRILVELNSSNLLILKVIGDIAQRDGNVFFVFHEHKI